MSKRMVNGWGSEIYVSRKSGTCTFKFYVNLNRQILNQYEGPDNMEKCLLI